MLTLIFALSARVSQHHKSTQGRKVKWPRTRQSGAPVLAARTYSIVVDASKVVEFFPGDHESGQVGSVNGEEDYREHCPHVGHEAGGEASGTVYVDGRLEEHSPHQPVGAEQGEPVRVRRAVFVGRLWNWILLSIR